MEIRPAEKEEIMYAYKNSTQIALQTGFIGYLRADMGSRGTEFYSTWFDFRRELKTADFRAEIDAVINKLRFDQKYGVLGSLYAMRKFCEENPQSAYAGNYATEYVFRVDTPEYVYLLRLNPVKGDYNAYAYCYQREALDRHMAAAKAGIRFIDSSYVTKFFLKDGEQVRIADSEGAWETWPARFIDPYHVEIGTHIFHICELAERLERNGSTIAPLKEDEQ